MSRLLKALLVVIALVTIPSLLSLGYRLIYGHGNSLMGNLPRFIVWAWDRPEDLRFLKEDEAGIAVLLAYVRVEGEQSVRVERRKHPMYLTPKTPLIAVVRIETSKPRWTFDQRKQALDGLKAVFDDSSVPKAVQIDFDATEIERSGYASLLQDLRRDLPKRLPISITALASWCMGDNWIRALPVDEAVPMLFRMGPDGPAVRRAIESGDDLNEELCRGVAGISTDEPLKVKDWLGRVYFFHPEPWTRAAFDKAVEPFQ